MNEDKREVVPRVTLPSNIINDMERIAKEKFNGSRSDAYAHALKFFLDADYYLRIQQALVYGKNV